VSEAQAEAARPPRAPREKPPHRGHVLVVDDIAENRELVVRRLKREGYTSVEAQDGLLALEALGRGGIDLVLLDIMMPNLDGMETLKRIQQHPEWRHVPVIMISANSEMERVLECLKRGATDFLPKPFDPTLLKVRVAASVEKKLLHDQEQRHLREIEESRARLAEELREAAGYVQSLLPPPLSGEIRSEWCFVPSADLGGDFLGHHWIDDDRLAIYLLDVSGHGVGAALLSVSVVNALRSETLPDVDFGQPGAVLAALNNAFPMERHNMMYFTAWYGVYRRSTRMLGYSSGGHPPALLVPRGAAASAIRELRTPGLMLGGMPDVDYPQAETEVEPGATLYVFSDGVYEVPKPDGAQMDVAELRELLAGLPAGERSPLQALPDAVRAVQGRAAFDDDFSALGVTFA